MTAEDPADTDAHLLADPADRDEIKAPLIREIKRLQDQIARAAMEPGQDRQKAMHAYAARAERAEAERDHAQEVAELAEKDRRTYHREALRAEAEVAELRAMRDRVRELADKYRKFSGFNITARGAEKQLRAALDGAGEQHE